jgi:hypothetical protein
MAVRPRDFLDRGHVRLQLQRDLAVGALTYQELATKYGATKSGIGSFAKKYADVVETIRGDLGNKFAGLWVADKELRVAAYMADIELVESETERVLSERDAQLTEAAKRAKAGELEVDEDGELIDAQLSVATDLGRLSRIKHRALRSVAEELGQLPTRMLVKAEGGGAVHVYGADVDTDKV